MKKPVMPSFAHYAWRKEELICWGPNQIMGLPVGGGKALWRIPYEVKYGVSITKPIYHEGIALVCGYWDGSRAIVRENRLMPSPLERSGGIMRVNVTTSLPRGVLLSFGPP